MKLAIIGGTGIDEMDGFRSERVMTVSTRFGDADVVLSRFCDNEIVFLPRHGVDHSVSPSNINYRAQIAALKKLEVNRAIGIAAVGSLTTDLPGGSFAVLGDFIDLTKRREDSFFNAPGEPVVHTDFTKPYCPNISDALNKACKVVNVWHKSRAVYVGVEGPRYESPAEIKLYSSWGAHVIGMTNLPEVLLAREAGICYGAIAVVSNLASGLSPTPLSHDEVRAVVIEAGDKLQKILHHAINEILIERECTCGLNTELVL